MATELQIFDVSLESAEDLSAKQFYLAMGYGTRQCKLATAASADLIGPIMNKPKESGVAAEIRVQGIGKVICGGDITAQAKITSDANGKAVAATATQKYCGRALEAGASGRLISVLMEHGYMPA